MTIEYQMVDGTEGTAPKACASQTANAASFADAGWHLLQQRVMRKRQRTAVLQDAIALYPLLKIVSPANWACTIQKPVGECPTNFGANRPCSLYRLVSDNVGSSQLYDKIGSKLGLASQGKVDSSQGIQKTAQPIRHQQSTLENAPPESNPVKPFFYGSQGSPNL